MHDVFLSFTRRGPADLAAQVAGILQDAGITTFVDESVPVGEGISNQIVDALADSRLLVVIYSAAYPGRRACQWELIQAYLAGAAGGDATGRLLVINPEPTDDHIVPAAVADTRYLRATDLARLPAAVRMKLARLHAPMSSVLRGPQPRWLPPAVPGVQGFVGRFPDLWRLHDALTAVERPLTQLASADPVVVVTGMGGIGKTSFVRAYAWAFGAAHEGGVYWTAVGGPGGVPAALLRFDDQVRALATTIGVPTEGMSTARVRLLVADHLDRQRRPSLWVIDDLPPDVTLDELSTFLVPSRSARHVFTTRRAGSGHDIARVALDGLGKEDAIRLLQGFRPILDADQAAAAAVAERLGGHPLALRAAGAVLEDQQGRMTYREYSERVVGRGTDAVILSAIEASMANLDGRCRALVAFAELVAVAPLPAQLLARVEKGLSAELGPATGDALQELQRRGAASRLGTTWQIHPLVVDAAARLAAPPVSRERIAVEAARALDALLVGAAAEEPTTAFLVQHAEAVVEHRHLLGDDLADTVLREIAAYYERIGDPVRAAARRYVVAAANPTSRRDQITYALAGVANQEFARAAEHARTAMGLDVGEGVAVQAWWARAAALDGLGRFEEAEPLWDRLDRAQWTPDPQLRIAFDVARARALVARGRLSRARALLEPLSDQPLDEYADQVNGARIELTRLLLMTGSERSARTLAAEVVAWYRNRDAEQHSLCLEAELVWAEAAVTLELFELRPDTSRWAEAEATLERLDEAFRSASAPDSVAELGVAVLRGLTLVRLGKQDRCRAVLLPAVEQIRDKLDDRHPLLLRARYALGLSHLQLNESPQAAALLGETWQEQRSVLGPAHPHTLATQLEYGVAAKFIGESRRSAELIEEVCRLLPPEVGRKNDLYVRAQFARGLLPFVPPWALSGMQTLERRLKRFRRER